MAVDNPFEITYGSRAVGGSSDDYQLHGPYVLEKTFESIRLVFDVVVVATTYATLQTLSDALEDDFRKRDQTLAIELDKQANPGSSKWTYTFGGHATNDDILNSRATISKTGETETDRGFSRSYTCTIEGDLPADDAATGLRDLAWNIEILPSQQKVVSMDGTYTALAGTDAVAKYQASAGADDEASDFLAVIDASATFELVRQNYTMDRHKSGDTPFTHICQFQRVYREILRDQTQTALDDTEIRDHSITFVDITTHPGDSAPDIHRLRRITGSYECAVDIDQTTDLNTVYDNKVQPHIRALFVSNFSPSVLAIEDRKVAYNETEKRLSASVTFLYQPSGADDLVELSESTTIQEARRPDFTPTHDGGQYSMYVDQGWTVKLRTRNRVAIAVGEDSPRRSGGVRGVGGGGDGVAEGASGGSSGWIKLEDTARISNMWVGDPDDEQIVLTVTDEVIVHQYVERPGGGGSNYVPGGTRKPIFNP